jgi:hypothetical protein
MLGVKQRTGLNAVLRIPSGKLSVKPTNLSENAGFKKPAMIKLGPVL